MSSKKAARFKLKPPEVTSPKINTEEDFSITTPKPQICETAFQKLPGVQHRDGANKQFNIKTTLLESCAATFLWQIWINQIKDKDHKALASWWLCYWKLNRATNGLTILRGKNFPFNLSNKFSVSRQRNEFIDGEWEDTSEKSVWTAFCLIFTHWGLSFSQQSEVQHLYRFRTTMAIGWCNSNMSSYSVTKLKRCKSLGKKKTRNCFSLILSF